MSKNDEPGMFFSLPNVTSSVTEAVKRVQPLGWSEVLRDVLVELNTAEADVAPEGAFSPEAKTTDQWLKADAESARVVAEKAAAEAADAVRSSEEAHHGLIAVPPSSTAKQLYTVLAVTILVAVGLSTFLSLPGIDLGLVRPYGDAISLPPIVSFGLAGATALLAAASLFGLGGLLVVAVGQAPSGAGTIVVAADTLFGLSLGILRVQLTGDWGALIPTAVIQFAVALMASLVISNVGRRLHEHQAERARARLVGAQASAAKWFADQAVARAEAARLDAENKGRALREREDAGRRRNAVIRLAKATTEAELVLAIAEYVQSHAAEPRDLPVARVAEEVRVFRDNFAPPEQTGRSE